ncbi:hypothetical protein QPK24_18495 [Paenibacillus polygoni]|uniref:Methyl-accepting chemotaxis protein n=1 Tax=Paenibacillus polygoni TaxID=3050112 RepID=A0ABY8WZR3_9BACL|nr:hypothetical protein [Paenibacillus polygoni]WIV18364.1 hypothetical protein QPK24_18495 [Paenibacillus polygoni]
MTDIELTKKRNNRLVFVLAAVSTVNEMLSFTIGISLQFILLVMGTIFLIIVPMTLLSNHPKFTRTVPYIKYFITLISGVALFLLIKVDPHMINIMTMYFYVAIMGIYQDRVINALTLLITLSILCFYFFTQGENIFHSTDVQDLLFYIITFTLVSVVNLMYAQFNNTLQQEKEQEKQRALEAKSAMETMLTKITESVQAANQYQNDLQVATNETNQRSIEIVSSIENIIESFEMQNKQSLLLANQFNQVNEQINNLLIPTLLPHQQSSSSSATTIDLTVTAPVEVALCEMKSMLQDLGAATEITVDMTEYNKGSLHDVLHLVSIQQQEIHSLSESFAKLEKQLSRMNRRSQL